MQLQIRKPVTIDVTQAEDRSSFTLHFITEGAHKAAITVPRDMLAGLITKLQLISADVTTGPANDDNYERRILAALAAGSTRAA